MSCQTSFFFFFFSVPRQHQHIKRQLLRHNSLAFTPLLSDIFNLFEGVQVMAGLSNVSFRCNLSRYLILTVCWPKQSGSNALVWSKPAEKGVWIVPTVWTTMIWDRATWGLWMAEGRVPGSSIRKNYTGGRQRSKNDALHFLPPEHKVQGREWEGGSLHPSKII